MTYFHPRLPRKTPKKVHYKRCNKCKKNKKLKFFYTRVMKGMAVTYSPCKACEGKAEKIRYKKLKKSIAERNSARYKLFPWIFRHNQLLSRFRKKGCAPKWLNNQQLNEILAFYKKASESKLTVDHIIPLNGKIVSGLHVPWNLQLMTLAENAKKYNHII